MTLQIFILLAGLLLILFGANWLVDGSSSIAKRFGISEFVIGLTIVGIGTSTPEMVVSFLSSLQGKADMAIGNIVGSNIFNTMMILGVTALITPLVITKSNLKKDIPLNIIVTIILIVLGMNFTLFGKGQDQLSRIDGAILLAIFIWYLWSSFKSDTPDEDEGEGIKEYSILMSVVLIIGGLAALIFGGRLFVNSATELAKMFGVSDKFIAITVMAAGTSMPELATCIVAALKGRGQLALGNIHLNIGTPLTSEEIAEAALCDKNDRYQLIRHAVDRRVIDGYRLWKNNYIAYDLLNQSYKYSHMYEPADVEQFIAYMQKQLDTVEPEINREDLRRIFLDIYANPVVTKELLEKEKVTGSILL